MGLRLMEPPQQEPGSSTRRARSAYLARTASRRSSGVSSVVIAASLLSKMVRMLARTTSSADLGQMGRDQLSQGAAQQRQAGRVGGVIGPDPAARDRHEAGIAQDLQVMRDGRLPEI